MKNEEQDKNDITNDTEIKSEKETWIITGDVKKKWVRKCPMCNCNVYHTQKNNRDSAIKKNKSCLECAKIKISKTLSGSIIPDEVKKKISKKLKGRPVLWKDKISKARIEYYKNNPEQKPKGDKNPMHGRQRFGIENPNFGNKWNEENLQKAHIRGKEQFLKRKEELGLLKIGYNPKACEYFNRLNEEKGWNLRHALNGGEIKCKFYFLDAYDKDRNIVVEYDEWHHYTSDGSLKSKDLKRQTEIINELKCEFYRFNEKQNKLTQII